MSSPQLRRADRAMSEQRAYEMLERGFSGQLATIGADGYPYCIPLLYIWMDGELYVHTGSAGGHFRANVERQPRICSRSTSRTRCLTTAASNAIPVWRTRA